MLMPELINDGPFIPDVLMNLQEEEKVVFFCGAGISVETGLPGFPGLVHHVYKEFGNKPDEVELEALDLPQFTDWDEIDFDRMDLGTDRRWQPKFDKALELLERKDRYGRQRPEDPSPMRETVVKRLSRKTKGKLDVHKAILTLSRIDRGMRLVTTNFDTRFESAARSMKRNRVLFNAAPMLPVPKPHVWYSCVHLHGVIGKDGRGDQLVLTAADFGRAYLTEGWASRFVTDLFHHFHVVFIGYSLDDPAMAYLVDALAAERARGGSIMKAYAFASYGDSVEGAEKRVERAWLAKNVEPILYSDKDGHRLLNDTLIEWAQVRENLLKDRKHMALPVIESFPDGPEGHKTRQVVWALGDPVAAQALADSPPTTQPSMFPKLIAWLDVFQENGLLARPVNEKQSKVSIAGTVFPPDLDKVGKSLCVWISRHLHVPQVLKWLLGLGGCLHPYLLDEISNKLADETLSKDSGLAIDPRLREMYTILVNQQTMNLRFNSSQLPMQYKLACDKGKNAIVRIALDSIEPHLIVRAGASSPYNNRGIESSNTPQSDEIEKCAHLELTLSKSSTSNDLYFAKKVLQKAGALGPFANILTDHLTRAIELLRDIGKWRVDTSFYRRSIADHDQNKLSPEWMELISWLRDSYFQLAGTNPLGAAAILTRWRSMREKVFHRLLLHVLSENPKADISLVESILLAGRNKGLWDAELRRELLRFLRLAGRRIPRDFRTKLISAIVVGPNYSRTINETLDAFREREIGIRLGKLRLAGVILNKKAESLAIQCENESETEKSHFDEFRIWTGVYKFEESQPQKISSRQLVKKIDNGQCPPDEYAKELCDNLLKGTLALIRLARDKKWDVNYWGILVFWLGNYGGDQENKARKLAISELYDAPDELIKGLETRSAKMLLVVAQTVPVDDEEKFQRLWLGAWKAIGATEAEKGQDLMTQVFKDDEGNLAEAAMTRLWLYKPEANRGLPPAVQPYFNAIGKKPESILARVILVQHLNSLFSIDPIWTKRCLIDPMANINNKDAKKLWIAYGSSGEIGVNLFNAIKEPLFEILKDYDDKSWTHDNLVVIFMRVCLDIPNEITPKEIHSVIDELPEKALVRAIQVFERRLYDEKKNKKAVWGKNALPWFNNYWPKISEKNTEQTSQALVEMIMETGKAFPDAVEWALPNLKEIHSQVYFSLEQSHFPGIFPDETLKLLKKIVPRNSEIPYEKDYLRQVLDVIEKLKPPLGKEPVFLKLYKIATS